MLAAALAASAAVLATSAAAAQGTFVEGTARVESDGAGAVELTGREPEVDGGPAPAAGASRDDGRSWVSVPVLSFQDSRYCRGSRSLNVPDAEVESTRALWNLSYGAALDVVYGLAIDYAVEPCAGGARVDLAPARDLLEQVVFDLPRPDPRIEPGYGLTGLRMYLERGVGGALTYQSAPVTVALGDVTTTVRVTATATYVVDWGDGTTTTHDCEGVGYERRDAPGACLVSHVWTDRGTYPVSVTDTWRLTAEIAGLPDVTLTQQLLPVRFDHEVREVQAVRER